MPHGFGHTGRKRPFEERPARTVRVQLPDFLALH